MSKIRKMTVPELRSYLEDQIVSTQEEIDAIDVLLNILDKLDDVAYAARHANDAVGCLANGMLPD